MMVAKYAHTKHVDPKYAQLMCKLHQQLRTVAAVAMAAVYCGVAIMCHNFLGVLSLLNELKLTKPNGIPQVAPMVSRLSSWSADSWSTSAGKLWKLCRTVGPGNSALFVAPAAR
jgi:hypothetical protein